MVRLFIAVPISYDIRENIKVLVGELKCVRGLPKNIRFVPEENWHFTLTFLGYQEETVITQIKTSIQYIDFVSQYIEFEKLTYGPGRTPRMLWLSTSKKTSEDLGRIKKSLEDELETGGVRWRRELRPYQAHLTLARFPQTPFKNLPRVERELDWKYGPDEIHLMKATLKRTGAEYETLFKLDFN